MVEYCEMITSKEIGKRIARLEKKGLDVPLIGRKPRSLKVQTKRALDRFIERLVLMHEGHQIVIALTGPPQMKGNRLALGLSLQIPMGRKGGPLSKSDKHRIEDFLTNAIEQGRLSRISSTRRASTGS